MPIFKCPYSNPMCTVQFSRSVMSTLCNPMNRSTPGLPVHHQLPEFTQTHAHWIGDAIQPSHPLSSPSPPAPNPSQHQGLFQWVNSLHEVAKVLEFQLQHHQPFQWTPRTDLKLTVYYLLACCVLFSFFHFLLYFSLFLFMFPLFFIDFYWPEYFFSLSCPLMKQCNPMTWKCKHLLINQYF